MADNTYSVGYATNARAKCKYSGCAESSIVKDSLRITKTCSSAFSEKPKAEYYHAQCVFMSFVRARKTTKKIESIKDIEGVDSLKPEDKENIKKYIKQWKDGELKDKVPKITRKRKAESDKTTETQISKKQKKAKDSSSESEDEKVVKAKPKAKAPVKRKPTKKEDSDNSDESSNDTKKRKTTKKQKDSDSDSEDDKVSKMMRKPVSSKKKVSVSSESDSEDEPVLKIQLKDTKKNQKNLKSNKKKDESDESEDIKKTNKKKKDESDESEEEKDDSDEESEDIVKSKKTKKVESDEEVEETSSSEKQESPKSKSKPLSGMVIALSGKLSMTSAEVAKLIEKNGGTFAKSITKDVTHVICAKMDDKTQKLTKAKDDGKILVDEKFLKKKINL